jgi:hypothetical protein
MTTKLTETTETPPAPPARHNPALEDYREATPAIHLTPRIAVNVERIATRAAELGDVVLESLCDDTLAGIVDPAEVYRAAMADVQYWPPRAVDRLLDDVYGRSDVRLDDAYGRTDVRVRRPDTYADDGISIKKMIEARTKDRS